MTDICTHSRIPFVHYAQDYDKVPDAAHMAQLLAQDSSITHVAMVHSETTSGILNDIQSAVSYTHLDVYKRQGQSFPTAWPLGWPSPPDPVP